MSVKEEKDTLIKNQIMDVVLGVFEKLKPGMTEELEKRLREGLASFIEGRMDAVGQTLDKLEKGKVGEFLDDISDFAKQIGNEELKDALKFFTRNAGSVLKVYNDVKEKMKAVSKKEAFGLAAMFMIFTALTFFMLGWMYGLGLIP